ncbi:hypothetical protein DSCO28_12060 [Desulfosarcina ovata subsp. sediminis]|uniref:Replication protein A C-terminal domain-containing protein n=1 Tax=Desulfosarcina ovata subsp. sediminis TaxID=885957 RepID=A0A5K7ZP76_9BACT|nr:hypothetical protein [Desulfosarcina ovata]BBO80640.1 hypothetical protein DSCO28_12060 [Desulfosarcina ovata subsp. sediminis]
MKKLARDLKTVAKQLENLSKKTESMAMAFEKSPSVATAPEKKTARTRAAKRKPAGSTPTDQVLAIMKRFKKGITVESLRGKSGFNEKQISNIVHRACKKGKMKRIGRGVYSVYDV